MKRYHASYYEREEEPAYKRYARYIAYIITAAAAIYCGAVILGAVGRVT